MLVRELIEKLQEMDQDAGVFVYNAHTHCWDDVQEVRETREYGGQRNYITRVDIEQAEWDGNLKAPIIEVFIE